jgi:hypothetical protein
LKLSHIKPNDKGCLYCRKICSCISDKNDLNYCYKTRINILINNVKLKNKPKQNKTNQNKPKQNNSSNVNKLQNTSDKKRKFTTTFDTESLYILDSSSNVCLKPYKKRKFIKHIDV